MKFRQLLWANKVNVSKQTNQDLSGVYLSPCITDSRDQCQKQKKSGFCWESSDTPHSQQKNTIMHCKMWNGFEPMRFHISGLLQFQASFCSVNLQKMNCWTLTLKKQLRESCCYSLLWKRPFNHGSNSFYIKVLGFIVRCPV